MRGRRGSEPRDSSCPSRYSRSSSAKARSVWRARAAPLRERLELHGDAARAQRARRSRDGPRSHRVPSRTRSRLAVLAIRATPDLAVNDRAGDDQQTLEDVLPLLVEPEKHRRVQHLDAEAGAHQGADERPPPTEEARPAEDDGGDRRQRVAGALAGVADAELRKQDHGAQEGQERCTDIADQGGAIDRHADAPSGFLVRSDSAEPHAELRTPENELEPDRSDDEHDERDRNRPDLRLDRIR